MHFILDVETFGQNTQTCPVIDISYITFDFNRFTTSPYTFNEIVAHAEHQKFDVAEQVKKYGCIVEESTIQWWEEQGKEARGLIKPRADDLSIDKLVPSMIDYLHGETITHWWSRSNTYDPIILDRIINYNNDWKVLSKNYLQYWKVRDTRTFIDAKSNFTLKNNGFVPCDDVDLWNSKFEKHNSIHDIAADILRMQYLVRYENNMEQVI